VPPQIGELHRFIDGAEKDAGDATDLIRYDNETLAPLAMRKVHTDEFFYEVKREEVK
jgi:hypothetical protein